MRYLITLIAFAAIAAVMAVPATAAPGTLYEQEGTDADGPSNIDASGQNSAEDANCTNWKYQYGSGSWSGVYAGSDGWVTCSEEGDMALEVEADIEMFCSESISNNKIYFHLGNIYTAGAADKIAYVPGSLTCNNGQYIGISFQGTIKSATSFEKDTFGNYTGVILDGMQSDNDTWRPQDNQMDVELLLDWGTGWTAPVAYGDGAHSTITDTLWWLVNGGAPGSYNYQWRVKLLPEPHQPDGDYYLDPIVVAAPVL